MMNNGKKGGMIHGKSHAKGGVRAIVTDQNRPIEVEGGESIVNKKSMMEDDIITVTGTPAQVVSAVNAMDGNGISFESGATLKKHESGEVMQFQKGGIVPTEENEMSYLRWDQVPKAWRNLSEVKPVKYELVPNDKGLFSIAKPFLLKDDRKPVFSGIYFSGNEVVATNAHILIQIPAKTKEAGVFATTLSAGFESYVKDGKITEKYPDVKSALPDPEDITETHQVDVRKLLQYCQTVNKWSSEQAVSRFKITDGESGYNPSLLAEVMIASLKLGIDTLYYHFTTQSRAAVFTESPEYSSKTQALMLIMPIFTALDFKLGSWRYGTSEKEIFGCYFDFTQNEICNADGSVADFQINYGQDVGVSKQMIKILAETITKRSTLPVFQMVAVKNNIAQTTNDLLTLTSISGVNVEDGMYTIESGALIKNNTDIDDFPTKSNWRVKGNKSFTINRTALIALIERLNECRGNDDLRPVMSGYLFEKRETEFFAVATDAHKLLCQDITNIASSTDTFKLIVRHLNLLPFLHYCTSDDVQFTFADQTEIDHKDCYAVRCGDNELIQRVIDGKYVNYEAVIPIYTPTKIQFNPKEFLHALSEKLEPLVKKYKTKFNYQIQSDYVEKNGRFVLTSKLRVGRPEYRKPMVIEEEVLLKDVEITVDSRDGLYVPLDSRYLIMPVMADDTALNFNAQFLSELLKALNEPICTLYFTDPIRATVFNGLNIDKFKSAGTKPKPKEKKSLIHRSKSINSVQPKAVNKSELEQMQEAIDGLTMLLAVTKGKEKKQIQEAIDALEMLKAVPEFKKGGVVPIRYEDQMNTVPLVVNDSDADVSEEAQIEEAIKALQELRKTFKSDAIKGKNKATLTPLTQIKQIDIVEVGTAPNPIGRKITSSQDAYEVLKSFWNSNKIGIIEQSNVLILDQANIPRAIYEHSTGGVAGTVIDETILANVCVNNLAKGVIIAHNHPSGALKPSDADKAVTRKVGAALKAVGSMLLDHIIITKEGYYSFADNGDLLS